MTTLIAVGAAVLRPTGLSVQRIGTRSRTRVPAKPTFTGMDYQLTGQDEQRVRIAAATVPLILDGLDCLAILQQIHQSQALVPYMRLGRHYGGTLTGLVVVETLDVDEGRLHPFTGVGRVVDVEAELILLSSRSSIGAVLSTGISAALTVAKQVFA